MKLEEVLPAMREGKIATHKDSRRRYRIKGGLLEVYDTVRREWRRSSIATVEEWRMSSLALDSWTLEPEPKVEWPKNSLGWACDLAIKSTTGKGGGNYFPRVRQSNNHLVEYRADTIMETPMRGERALALNWEPVP